jgi:hypothetical protein
MRGALFGMVVMLVGCGAAARAEAMKELDEARAMIEAGRADSAIIPLDHAVRAAPSDPDVIAEANRLYALRAAAGRRGAVADKVGAARSAGEAALAATQIPVIHEARRGLRDAGGDAALDARLVARLAELAEAAVASAERLETFAAPSAVVEVLRVPDVPSAIVDRARRLRTRAVEAHRVRAAAATASLTRRLHEGLAARLEGGTLPDPAPLFQRFATSVRVTAVEPRCAAAERAIETALAGGSGGRELVVEVAFTSCVTDETRTSGTKTSTWQEQVPDGSTTERVCTPGPKFYVKPGTSGVSPVANRGGHCELINPTDPYTGRTDPNEVTWECTEPVCNDVAVPKHKTVDRSATGPTTTHTVSVVLAGNLVVRHEGGEERLGFQTTQTATDLIHGAIGKLAPDADEGLTPASLATKARAHIAEQAQAALATFFSTEAHLAFQAATKLDASTPAGEDGWAEVVVRTHLVGRGVATPLAGRYGVGHEAIREALVATSFPTEPPPSALPEAAELAPAAPSADALEHYRVEEP